MILVLFLLFGRADGALAQLATEGNWAATTIKANTVVSLTGDVNVKGTIAVNDGYTLTILNESGKDITLSNKASGVISMFTAKSGAKLIIRGSEGSGIIIDGGADYTWDPVDMTLTSGTGKKVNTVLVNNGRMELEHVTILNAYSSNDNAAALDINSRQQTVLTNCTIRKCRARLGAAIMINTSSGTPEASAVRVTDSFITQCVSGGSSTASANNVGGAIRTYGGVVSNLYLTGVTLSENYSMCEGTEYNNTLVHDGNGGALFWNGRGHEDTACYIESCLFENNRCDDNGGAIKAQGSIFFVKGAAGSGRPENTIIRNNKAPVGAGLYIEGYTGGVSLGSARTIDYDLSNLEVYGNEAPSYTYGGADFQGKGAGVHFYFGKDMKLEAGSTINVNMKGALIHDNSTTGYAGLGGGIYVENNVLASKNYKINIKMDYGKIYDNMSGGSGGGVYILNESVTSTESEGQVLELRGNSAVVSGAGMHIEGGSFEMTGSVIADNVLSAPDGIGAGVYINGGSLVVNEGSINGNQSLSEGGGAYVAGGGSFTMSGGEIKLNKASENGGGAYLDGGNFLISAGSITQNSSHVGGGAYVAGGGSFTMSGGKMTVNAADENGGGVYLDGGSFIFEDGSIDSNTAGKEGGGACVAGGGSFIMSGGVMSVNVAAENGGGAYLDGGNFSISSGYIEGNKSVSGAGAYVAGGGNFTMTGGGLQFNEASGNGGGASLDGGSFNISDGAIVQNHSVLGGGAVYIVGGGDFNMTGGKLQQNTTDANGGGAYICDGELNVTNGSIEDNSADLDGGGICILNGAVDMGSGQITSNTCGQYGGGIYVFNESAIEKRNVTISGGSLNNNTAMYGGGLCVDGYINLVVGDVEIAENTAVNGGGVCLLNKADMKFGKGHIKNNEAAAEAGIPPFSTAYQKEITEVSGIGGGIYIGTDSALTFTEIDNLGLFGNLAERGADEIFANGKSTTVTIPDVTSMNLSGYPGASNLKWMEDYITDDPDYDKGTKMRGTAWDSDKSNQRYRVANAANAAIYEVAGGSSMTKYISLALGYEVIYITLVKSGLKAGESAVFDLLKGGIRQVRVMMTGVAGQDKVTKKIAVTVGEWTVREIGWGWTYANASPSLTKDITAPEDRTFEFVNVKKTGSALPQNHESVNLNIMGM